jgi:hypothetical protein
MSYRYLVEISKEADKTVVGKIEMTGNWWSGRWQVLSTPSPDARYLTAGEHGAWKGNALGAWLVDTAGKLKYLVPGLHYGVLWGASQAGDSKSMDNIMNEGKGLITECQWKLESITAQ